MTIEKCKVCGKPFLNVKVGVEAVCPDCERKICKVCEEHFEECPCDKGIPCFIQVGT